MKTFGAFIESKSKPAKEIWQMSANGPEYAALDIDVLDRAAFGFTEDDVKQLMPDQIEIKWTRDYNAAVWDQRRSGMAPREWARRVDLSEPIDVSYEGGRFVVEDGHHRYYAAKLLKRPLRVNLTIKDKPHRAVVEKALRQGLPVPPEVLANYPDLQHTRF
jgi:hypothetical protein